MKIMLETTVWDDPGVPNHVYIFNDSMSKAIAYVRAGTKEVFKFKNPLGIDTRGRTFVPLDDEPEPVDSGTITVQGSKGQTYYLSKPEGSWVCTCPGFTFRGNCRHTKEVDNK